MNKISWVLYIPTHLLQILFLPILPSPPLLLIYGGFCVSFRLADYVHLNSTKSVTGQLNNTWFLKLNLL